MQDRKKRKENIARKHKNKRVRREAKEEQTRAGSDCEVSARLMVYMLRLLVRRMRLSLFAW